MALRFRHVVVCSFLFLGNVVRAQYWQPDPSFVAPTFGEAGNANAVPANLMFARQVDGKYLFDVG